jgi:hypothetical protein
MWSLNYSVFAARKKECDSRSFVDDPRMLEAACATDIQLMKLPSEFTSRCVCERQTSTRGRHTYIPTYRQTLQTDRQMGRHPDVRTGRQTG